MRVYSPSGRLGNVQLKALSHTAEYKLEPEFACKSIIYLALWSAELGNLIAPESEPDKRTSSVKKLIDRAESGNLTPRAE